MNRRTREELKESLKWIRWKKYRKKVRMVELRFDIREVIIVLRDENKKWFKNVTIRKRMYENPGIEKVIDEYVNKKMGYVYIEGVE